MTKTATNSHFKKKIMILRLFAIILLPIYAVTMLIVTILSIFLWIYNKKFVMDYETPQKIDKLYWKIFL